MKTFALVALLGSTIAASSDICCNTCPDNMIKTWSIDDIFHQCGEGCIQESKFWLYHLFEKNLTKASSNTATECADRGYTLYDSTQTHGIPHILSVTVDLYKTPKSALFETHQ